MRVRLPRFLKKLFSPHKHRWELVTKTVSEPKTASAQHLTTENLSQEFLDKLVFGLTTYLWECKECGGLRRQECLGSETTFMDEILDRVDSYGSQTVSRQSKDYVVVPRTAAASPQSHPAPQSRLPIRQP